MMQRDGWVKGLTKLVILMTVLAGMQGYSNAVVIARLDDGRLFLPGSGRFSADDGKTWGWPRYLSLPHVYICPATHAAIRLQDGTLFWGISWNIKADHAEPSTQSTSDYWVGALVSDDDGETWTLVGEVHAEYEDSPTAIGGVDEPSYVQLPDGELYMLMRTGAGCLYETRSSDGGKAWSEAKPTQFMINDSPSAMHRLHTGEVVLIGQPAGLGRLCIWVSRDNCQTWSGPKPISGEPIWGEAGKDLFCGGRYCGITEATDGRILAVWSQYVPRPPVRVMQIGRFNRAWLPGAPATEAAPFLEVSTLE